MQDKSPSPETKQPNSRMIWIPPALALIIMRATTLPSLYRHLILNRKMRPAYECKLPRCIAGQGNLDVADQRGTWSPWCRNIEIKRLTHTGRPLDWWCICLYVCVCVSVCIAIYENIFLKINEILSTHGTGCVSRRHVSNAKDWLRGGFSQDFPIACVCVRASLCACEYVNLYVDCPNMHKDRCGKTQWRFLRATERIYLVSVHYKTIQMKRMSHLQPGYSRSSVHMAVLVATLEI